MSRSVTQAHGDPHNRQDTIPSKAILSGPSAAWRGMLAAHQMKAEVAVVSPTVENLSGEVLLGNTDFRGSGEIPVQSDPQDVAEVIVTVEGSRSQKWPAPGNTVYEDGKSPTIKLVEPSPGIPAR